MANVKHLITKGIGASPGKIGFFTLFGLSPQGDIPVQLSLESRTLDWTLEGRTTSLGVRARTLDWTLEGDPR